MITGNQQLSDCVTVEGGIIYTSSSEFNVDSSTCHGSSASLACYFLPPGDHPGDHPS